MNITKTGHRFLLSVVTAACLLLVTACDMPIGLGSRVNTTVPRITPGPGDNQPGAFLRGDRNLVKLDVQQPFGLSSVFMDIWYFDLGGIERERRIPASQGADGLWVVNIDTTGMRDGTIRGQVTAIDGDGNTTTTTELVYTVKNTPPQIELTIPRISGNEFDRITSYTPVLRSGGIFWGNDIMGIASDAFGIAHGYPQIRLWPVLNPATGSFPEGVSPGDFDSISGLPLPGTEWYDWRPMLDEQGRPFDDPRNAGSNLRASQFRWPLQNRAGHELETGYYRFQIRTRDLFGILNTYPKRLDHELSEDSLRNAYFQIQIIATDNPVIRWSPAGDPIDYEGFPNFYNAREDLVVYLTIRTGNTLSRAGTRARISINDRIEDNEWEPGDYQFVDHVSGNLHRITMSRDDVARMLGGEAQLSGDRILHVEAVDYHDNKSATSRPIIIDNTPPTMMFIEPVGLGPSANPRVTSSVTFRGNALDNQRVARMYYVLGAVEVNNPFLGRTLENVTGWTDTGLHTNNPRQGHPHGPGLPAARVSWSGTLSSWNWRFTNIADVTSSVPAQNHFVTQYGDPEQNLWLLPIEFRLVDVAGNISFYRVNVLVDPDADLPLVFINSHVTGQTVGGQIRIGGTAEDNEMIHNVQVRIFRQSNAVLGTDAAPAELVQNWTSVNTPANNSAAISWYTIINRDGELDPPPGHRIRRVRLDFRAIDAFPGTPHIPKGYGPVSSLFLDFDNTVPFIYTPILLRGSPSEIGEANLLTASGVEFDHVAGTLISGSVTMRVRARDESGLISIRVRGGGVPHFYDLLPAARGFNDFYPWVVTPGEVRANGQVLAGRKYRIIERGISHNLYDLQDTLRGEYLVNEATFIASTTRNLIGQGTVLMEANAGPMTQGGEDFQDFEYTIFIPLNTDGASRFGSGFAREAGPFALEIQVADNSTPTPFITQNSYQLRVDNRHPLGIFTGNLTVTNPRYTIAGSAWDSGSGVQVQGVDRVVVYFSRPDPVNANNAIPLSLSGVPVNTGWVNDQSVLINRTGTHNEVAEQGTLHTLPFFPSNFEANGTGISIRTGAPVPTGARFTAINLGSPPVHSWYIGDFNFAGFPDGPLTIHYVIFDHAGNATHYAQEIFLAINRPVINSIHLGTNIGGVERTENITVPHNALRAYFRVRNNTFSLRPVLTGGTGAIDFDIAYIDIDNNRTRIPAADMRKGNIYTIASEGSVTWINYGVFAGSHINPRGITFVAIRDAGENMCADAFVYRYTLPNAGVRRIQGTWPANTAEAVTFGAASFSGSGAIPDSNQVLLPDRINFALQNDRYFLVRVTDSYGISNAALVRVDIHNTDETPPVINIAHFGYEVLGASEPDFVNRNIVRVAATAAGYNMNIVRSGAGIRMGYVQHYRDSLAAPHNYRADISGMVIFRGRAADNDRIERITVTVGGEINTAGAGTSGGITTNAVVTGGTTTTLAAWSAQQNKLMPYGGNTIARMRDTAGVNWGFEAPEQLNTLNHGHVFNWEAAWDSSSFPGMVGNNVPITFTVTDFADETISQTIWVNIVPYITEIITPLNDAFRATPSAFNRSARGWFPVRQGDEITIRGFNLGSPGTTRVSLPGMTSLLPASGANVTSTRIVATIGTAATSGPLVVTVTAGGNEITSINNRNNNNVHYNQESNNLNNNILNDDRFMYVWQIGYLLNQPVVTNPVMRMHNNSTWFLTYGRFGSGIGGGEGTAAGNAGTNAQLRIVRGAPAGTGAAVTDNQVQQEMNRYLHMGMAIDGFGDWFIGASNMTAANTQTFSIYARAATTSGTGSNQSNGSHHRRLLRLDGHADRVRTPSIFALSATPASPARGTDNDPTRVLVSYFDSINNNNALFFHYGLVGGNAAGALSASAGFGGNFPAGANSATATNPTNNAESRASLFPGAISSTARPTQVVAHNGTYHQGSSHVAVGALRNGLPVIAWYDRTNQRLVFSFGDDRQLPITGAGVGNLADARRIVHTETGTPNTPNTWQGNAQVVHDFAGTHVAMAIDEFDYIHLAYFDVFNGGLFYARIPPTADRRRPNTAAIQIARVDTFLSAGTNITINVRNENGRIVPYISYFHVSFAETRNSIRVAWLRPDASGNMTVRHGTFGNNNDRRGFFVSGHESSTARPVDSFTGEWEVMTVPAYTVPLSNEFVSNGVPTGGQFRPRPNSGLPVRSLTNSILVGYMTASRYEAAVLLFDGNVRLGDR